MAQACYISQIGVFLPGKPIDNSECLKVLNGENKRSTKVSSLVLRSNGIKYRHYALDPITREPTHSNAELAATAIRNLLQKNQKTLQDIGGLFCGTSSPDQLLPTHANMVHSVLQNPACEAVSVAGVCTSSLVALDFARLKILAGENDNLVVSGSENASLALRIEAYGGVDPATAEAFEPSQAFQSEFIRWMLSDGASAAWLQSKPEPGKKNFKIEWIETISFGNELETCMWGGAIKDNSGTLQSFKKFPGNREALGMFSLRQDSRILEKNIISVAVDGAFGRILNKRNLKPDDVNWYVPHYSSEYFRPKLLERYESFGFPIAEEKWFTNLSQVGNIGSASLFTALEELQRKEELKVGDKILCMVPESAKFTVSYTYLSVC